MPAKSTTSPVSKQQVAYDYIKAGIEGGTFAPRQRLIIDSLARDLDVSKVPVREAVRRLEAEGLVTYSTNAGAEVAGADPSLWFNLMEMLAVMEGYATASAAAHITEGDLAKLKAINVEMAQALEAYNFSGWTEGNHRFHATINARCPNPAFIEQMEALQVRTKTISRFVFHSDAAILHTLGPDSGKSALEAHDWLVTAFERKEKPGRIEGHARDHILQVANQTLRLLENAVKTTSGLARGRGK